MFAVYDYLMKGKYDEIEYPKLAKGKSYREYLRDAGLKGYGANGAPVPTCREMSRVEGMNGHLFNGPRPAKSED